MSITRTAPAPTTATSSVVFTCGLLTIPLSIYTSTESTAVIRKEFLGGDPSIPVGRIPVRKDTDEPISQAQITRMTEADNGAWVILADDEIKECVGIAGGCEVVTFVPIKDAGQYLTEGLYQVRPKADKKGGAATVAVFNLLLAGMTARKVHALVKFALRGVPRYAMLTADGDLLLIATADQIRQAMPLPDGKPSKAEVNMICNLIDAIGIDAPVVVDDISAEVRKYVNTKANGGAGVVAGPMSPTPSTPVDLNAILEASIEAVRKNKAA